MLLRPLFISVFIGAFFEATIFLSMPLSVLLSMYAGLILFLLWWWRNAVADETRVHINLFILWIGALSGLFLLQLTSELAWVRHTIAGSAVAWNFFWTRVALGIKGDIRNPPPISFFLANQAVGVLLYTITVFFYNLNIVLQIRSWWPTLSLLMVTGCVVFLYCKIFLMRNAESYMMVALTILATLELSFIFSFLPFSASTTALLHTAPLFVLMSVVFAHYQKCITGKLFVQRVSVAAFLSVLVLVLTRWS